MKGKRKFGMSKHRSLWGPLIPMGKPWRCSRECDQAEGWKRDEAASVFPVKPFRGGWDQDSPELLCGWGVWSAKGVPVMHSC